MGKLGALTKEIVEVELRLAKVQQFAAENSKFHRLLDRREQAAAAVAESRPTRGKGAAMIDDVRKMLGDAMQQWLVSCAAWRACQACRFPRLLLPSEKPAIKARRVSGIRTLILRRVL
jgi:hypothetical protein